MLDFQLESKVGQLRLNATRLETSGVTSDISTSLKETTVGKGPDSGLQPSSLTKQPIKKIALSTHRAEDSSVISIFNLLFPLFLCALYSFSFVATVLTLFITAVKSKSSWRGCLYEFYMIWSTAVMRFRSSSSGPVIIRGWRSMDVKCSNQVGNKPKFLGTMTCPKCEVLKFSSSLSSSRRVAHDVGLSNWVGPAWPTRRWWK